jgi:hypothetical protein
VTGKDTWSIVTCSFPRRRPAGLATG